MTFKPHSLPPIACISYHHQKLFFFPNSVIAYLSYHDSSISKSELPSICDHGFVETRKAWMPDEANCIKNCDPPSGNMTWLAKNVLTVLTLLMMNPCYRFWVLCIQLQYQSMAICRREFLQFSNSFAPCGFFSVPKNHNQTDPLSTDCLPALAVYPQT